MKDLKLDKTSIKIISDDQLEGLIGGTAQASCITKSCGEGPEIEK